MLNIEEIKKYYPSIRGFDLGILREYLQYKILDIIFKNKVANKLSFLGGTAIKICYGSGRFSEDLDFDNFSLSQDEFIDLSSDIKTKLELEGYQVEIKNVFKGAFRSYIKILNVLQKNNLSVARDEKILVQLDTFPHNFDYQVNDFLMQKFDVFRNIKVTPVDIILSMKIATIFGRKRMKGRDFYDIVYLLGQGDFNYQYLDYKLSISNEGDLKKALLDFISDLDFKSLALDVEPFLIKPDDKDLVLFFKDYIQQRLS